MKNHFFDIGANTGQTFDWFLNANRKYDGWCIWCFEPSIRSLPGLMETVNKFRGMYHVMVCPFAVGKTDSILRVYENYDPLGDSLLPKCWAGSIESKPVDTDHKIMASVVPLSRLILNNTEPGDNVEIKLDCEGGEYDCLRSLLESSPALARVSKIMVEWHGTGKTFHGAEKTPDNPVAFQDEFSKLGITLEPWPF